MISERTLVRSFNSFWNELLPLLTPRFVAEFNSKHQVPLRTDGGVILEPLPVGCVHPDLVAEFAFRLARQAHEQGIDIDDVESTPWLVDMAEKDAWALIDRYEGRKPVRELSLSAGERFEGILLCRRYNALFATLDGPNRAEFCPSIPGAGFLQSTEADIGVNEVLIEVKTTTRVPSGHDIRQLVVYLALDASGGSNRWSRVGIFNPRRGTLHCIGADDLLFQISGGRARLDVFSELISFAQSASPPTEQRF